MGTTTVQLDEDTADALHELKRRGDTYDDVTRRLVESEHGEGAVERLAEAQLAK